jgi:RES domain-containing protein
MEVFRLTKEKYATILSGKGAAFAGARWNSPGVELIYTSANRSLAMAEVAVHLTLATLPSDFMIMTIHIPNNLKMKKITTSELPPNWSGFPPPSSNQAIGDKFVTDNKYCVLQIPSAVTQGDFNFLINPNHPDFMQIKIVGVEKFPFDNRIFR